MLDLRLFPIVYGKSCGKGRHRGLDAASLDQRGCHEQKDGAKSERDTAYLEAATEGSDPALTAS